MQENVPTYIYEYAHSMRIEPMKLILVGTRKTYQATGDGVVMNGLSLYQKPKQVGFNRVKILGGPLDPY